MKKYVFIIGTLLSLAASAQEPKIDTVYVRNLTMQVRDWCYFIGKTDIDLKDSAQAVSYLRIRTLARASGVTGMNQNLTIDSIPGRIAVRWYNTLKGAAAAEIETRYTAISNAFANKPNISYWIGYIDAAIGSGFSQAVDRGKHFFIGN